MEKLKNVFNTMVEKVKHFYSTKRKEKVVASVLALLVLVAVTVFAVNSMVKPVNPTVDVKDPEVVEKEDETDEVEVEKPADKDEVEVEKPADKDEDKVEKPADKPTEKPADKPADKPVAKPTPKPDPKPDPKPTPPPAHTHNWIAVYKEHPAETKDVWVDKPVFNGESGYYVGNGLDRFVSVKELERLYGTDWTMEQYLKDNGWRTENYRASKKATSLGYYEKQVVKPAWKELTHYVCNADGATKKP